MEHRFVLSFTTSNEIVTFNELTVTSRTKYQDVERNMQQVKRNVFFNVVLASGS